MAKQPEMNEEIVKLITRAVSSALDELTTEQESKMAMFGILNICDQLAGIREELRTANMIALETADIHTAQITSRVYNDAT